MPSVNPFHKNIQWKQTFLTLKLWKKGFFSYFPLQELLCDIYFVEQIQFPFLNWCGSISHLSLTEQELNNQCGSFRGMHIYVFNTTPTN